MTRPGKPRIPAAPNRQGAIARALFCLFAALILAAALITPASAQDTPQPDLPEELVRERTILRILTSNDFPPFNYYDEEGNLSGFHIDLANAICREMAVRCDIRVSDWDKLLSTFKTGDSDAIIAGLAVNKRNMARLDFTNPYMRMPARFAVLKRRPQPEPTPRRLDGKTVGVVKETAHAAYLATFFKDAKMVRFEDLRAATTALQKGEVDYLFGDAIQIMFWLNGSLSRQCCQFRGDAYWDAKFFGEGLAIAIAKGDMRLRMELNDAIREIRRTGQFEELMLRYFPLKIY